MQRAGGCAGVPLCRRRGVERRAASPRAQELQWHFEVVFLFADEEREELAGEPDEEDCGLDQDASLALLDALRWL